MTTLSSYLIIIAYILKLIKIRNMLISFVQDYCGRSKVTPESSLKEFKISRDRESDQEHVIFNFPKQL